MNTNKIPEGWYEITGQPTRKAGDMYLYPSLYEDWKPIENECAEDIQWPGFRYIRRIPSQQDDLAAQVAALTRKLNHLPSTASETTSTGVLAAAEAVRKALGWPPVSQTRCIVDAISRHCVDKEDHSKFCMVAWELDVSNRAQLATEKARADNLQAELTQCEKEKTQWEAEASRLAEANGLVYKDVYGLDYKLKAANKLIDEMRADREQMRIKMREMAKFCGLNFL